MPSDPRAVQAREAHRLAAQSDRQARQHRELRDRIIRALRADGWTYPQIAAAVGCKKELARAVVTDPRKTKPAWSPAAPRA